VFVLHCRLQEGTVGNETHLKQLCDCINECDVTEFAAAISSGRMSPQAILDDISASSEIRTRFLAATETRNRVDASTMMQTVKLLTDATEVHR